MFRPYRFENKSINTHQDVGQMDMYVRMYDERIRGEGDNPTIGIVLCSETDEDIALYSALHDNNQLLLPNICCICLRRKSYAGRLSYKNILPPATLGERYRRRIILFAEE